MSLRDPTRAQKTYSFYRAAPLAYSSVYNRVQSNLIAVAGRATLNFSSKFTVADNAGNQSTDVDLAVKLNDVYGMGYAPNPSTIFLSVTNGGIQIRDAFSSPLGTSLFNVTNFSGSAKYLDVSATSVVSSGSWSVSGSFSLAGKLTTTGSAIVSGGIACAGPVTASFFPFITNTVPIVTGTYGFGQPGYYNVLASGTAAVGSFTGSLPTASLYPGSRFMVVDTLGQFGWLLTGTVAGVTSFASNVFASASGTKLTMTSGSSVALFSDSRVWVVVGVSGSAAIT